jgi:hypothetical protein
MSPCLGAQTAGGEKGLVAARPAIGGDVIDAGCRHGPGDQRAGGAPANSMRLIQKLWFISSAFQKNLMESDLVAAKAASNAWADAACGARGGPKPRAPHYRHNKLARVV